MRRIHSVIVLFAMVIACAGCSGEGEKAVIQHKDKPVQPAPEPGNAGKK